MASCWFQSTTFLLKWSDSWLAQSWLHGASLFPLCFYDLVGMEKQKHDVFRQWKLVHTIRFSLNIHGMVHTLNSCYTTYTNATLETISIKANNANHSGVILNIDGNCLDSQTRVGYGGILRNDVGSTFQDFPTTFQILLTLCMLSYMYSIMVSC
jgi:hypothetical protein